MVSIVFIFSVFFPGRTSLKESQLVYVPVSMDFVLVESHLPRVSLIVVRVVSAGTHLKHKY